jgi:DNA-binding NtrC family response regulator
VVADEVRRVLAETGVHTIAPAEALALPEEQGRSSLLRPLAEQVAALEARAIAAAMAETGGNKLAAARLLGISRATLYGRLQAG